MPETILSGTDLERALNSDEFDQRQLGTVSIVALVRKSRQKDHVSLAVAGCESFVDIPTVLIESAEKIGAAMCGEHNYPRMRIGLSISQDPVAQILAKLLALKEDVSVQSLPRRDNRMSDDSDEDRYHRFRR